MARPARLQLGEPAHRVLRQPHGGGIGHGVLPRKAQHGQRRGRGVPAPVPERDDCGADHHRLGQVVVGLVAGGAGTPADPQAHVPDHGGRALAVPGGVGGEPAAGTGPGLGGEVGVALDLLVGPVPAAELGPGPPVVVPDGHRDAEQQRRRHPARGDQLPELLSGQVRGERVPRADVAVGPHGRADRPELQPGTLERGHAEPHGDDPVAAAPGPPRPASAASPRPGPRRASRAGRWPRWCGRGRPCRRPSRSRCRSSSCRSSRWRTRSCRGPGRPG